MMSLERRVFLGLAATGGAVWAVGEFRGSGVEARAPELVAIAEFDKAGRPAGVKRVPSIVRSAAEWKRVLATDQFWMTRRADTEFAYTGQFWNFHGDGLYRCICCATALFDSRLKFDSGTGWPSFSAPVAHENVTERDDRSFGMLRREVRCRRCEAHHGHVFEDGPEPSGRRYCVNSTGLAFAVRDFT